ncbi:hypothetical protein [Nocardia salmonicida]|uniref:hypothetical protein n=1 Tax=Nocardia salmonicida TaxID=53431 RepID=UPI003CEC7193
MFEPKQVDQAVTSTALLDGVPVVMVVPRARHVGVASTGQIVDSDIWTSTIIEHSGRALLDTTFGGPHTAGWAVTLDQDAHPMRVDSPAGEITGELIADHTWWQRALHRHRGDDGVPVITDTTLPNPAAALAMIEADQAVWVLARTHLES